MNTRLILIQILDITYIILYCLLVFLKIVLWSNTVRLIILLYNIIQINNLISKLNVTDINNLITNITNITNFTEIAKIEL
jgi:hypothetical protein